MAWTIIGDSKSGVRVRTMKIRTLKVNKNIKNLKRIRKSKSFIVFFKLIRISKNAVVDQNIKSQNIKKNIKIQK